MGKSALPRLYGAKHPNPTSMDGTFKALKWAELRAPNAWGYLRDEHDSLIVWFNDPTARQEFQQIFGGISVTLNLREERIFTGKNAIELMKKVG